MLPWRMIALSIEPMPKKWKNTRGNGFWLHNINILIIFTCRSREKRLDNDTR
jgi:hypothetical protein